MVNELVALLSEWFCTFVQKYDCWFYLPIMYVSFKWRRCWWDGCTTDLLWSVPIPQTAWYPCFDGNSCIRWSYSFIFQWFLLCIGPKCCCFNPHFCLDQTFPDFGLHQGAMVLTCFDPPVSVGYTRVSWFPCQGTWRAACEFLEEDPPVLGIELCMPTDLHCVAAAYPHTQLLKQQRTDSVGIPWLFLRSEETAVVQMFTVWWCHYVFHVFSCVFIAL